jgi:hypothetical protein
MSAAFNCDGCKQFKSGDAPIKLQGQFFTRRAGILLPQYTWDFCGLGCFDTWFGDIVGLQRSSVVEERANE